MTGVFVCTCRIERRAPRGRRPKGKPAPSWLEKVKGLAGTPLVFGSNILCSDGGISLVARRAKEKKLKKLLLAGCPALQSGAYARSVSRKTGIPSSAIDALLIPSAASPADAARAIRRAHAALELLPLFETRRVSLGQDVLVMGGGAAGALAAGEIAALGFRTTIVEKADRLGGGEGFGLEATRGAETEILTGTRLVSLQGGVGNFTARLAGVSGETERAFGAVVIATGVETAPAGKEPFAPGRVVPLSELESHMDGLARRDRPRHIAILLDARVEEGKASTEAAIRAALSLRARFATEVSVVLHDVRVSASGLEALYDQARETGVSFVKYDGAPVIAVSEDGVAIRCRDSVLGEEVEIACGLAAVSACGLPAAADGALADAAGIGRDGQGRMQENNVHLLPGLAGREGVFVVGACRGETFGPSVARDARDVALSVHALLSRRSIEVEQSHAVVDGDKCVLCLTCVRSCPFRAMRIDAKEKKADCIPEACRRCGICAGECPAKAIELPAHSDRIVLARAGV